VRLENCRRPALNVFAARSKGLNAAHSSFGGQVSDFSLDKGYRTKVKVSVRNYSHQFTQAEIMPSFPVA
jgi:hypothetical protein